MRVEELAITHPAALAGLTKIDGEAGPAEFLLWPHQREFITEVVVNRRTIVLKARQLGFTWAMALVALWYVMRYPGRRVVCMSIGEREAQILLERVRILYNYLPAAVRQAFPLGANDNTTRMDIAHPEEGTYSAILSIPSSGGRSETAHLLLLDEAAHWDNSDKRLAAILPTAADGAMQVVINSTANGMQGIYHRLYVGAPTNGWKPMFIRADARPGRDEAWITNERSQLGELGPQEYPMSEDEAFIASGLHAFDVPTLMWYRSEMCVDPVWKGVFDIDRVANLVRPTENPRGWWWVWDWPEQGREYLVTADACGGPGARDYASAVIVDIESWEQVAALHGKPSPTELARQLYRAGWMYGADRPAMLAPEANNHGTAVIAHLREWRYPRLYESERIGTREQKLTGRYGWETTMQSRAHGVARLADGIKERTLGIRDNRAISEMIAFVLTDADRYEAGEGAHDDLVASWWIQAAILSSSRQHRRTDVAPRAQKPYRPRVSTKTGY